MKWIGVLAFALVVSACASAVPSGETVTTTVPPDPTTTIEAPKPTAAPGPAVRVVTIADDGGCYMMGPNCATYIVYSNGTVELYRTRVEGPPEETTIVDVALLDKIRDLLASTDLDALHASLPEGEVTAAYDGVDTTFTYAMPDGEAVFASAVVELVTAEPLFATTWKIREIAQTATDLHMQTWP